MANIGQWQKWLKALEYIGMPTQLPVKVVYKEGSFACKNYLIRSSDISLIA